MTASWAPRKRSNPKVCLRVVCGSVIYSLDGCGPSSASVARASLAGKLFRGLGGFLGELFGRLAVPQVGVETAQVEQLLVRSAFGDAAGIEHDHEVGVDDG